MRRRVMVEQEDISVPASVSESEKRNEKAWQKMDLCQRETGKTTQELLEQQQTLRAEFYRRSVSC